MGHPALRRLTVLKLRAWLRASRRRLASPAGALFGLVGFGFMLLWVASLFLHGTWMEARTQSGPELEVLTRGGIALLVLLAAISSLSHRGLYLPKEEIERLLSAPLARADLVRYRLWMTMGKSLFFSLIMAWFFSRRMPEPWLGFAGAFVALSTLPLVGQAVALLAGNAENRLARVSKGMPFAALRVVVGLCFWAFLMLFLFAGELAERFPGVFDSQRGMMAWLAHPAVAVLTLPFAPWASAMTAASTAEFWPPFVATVAIWALAFELVARLPIDFRELSLATSADVARRLERMRRGRAVGGSARLTKGGFGWRVPWLFGRGPFGAVAWLQACGIVRKARGTLVFAAFVTTAITVVTSQSDGMGDDEPIARAAAVAGLATVYLGWGLRFDFRSSLDTMAAIKAWPLPGWKVFAAMLLPEVCLVSVLVALAVLAQSAMMGNLVPSPAVLLVIAGVPFVAMLWFALDNAVFLLLPVRHTPGQGGAMHHTGRQMVMVFLRMIVLAAVLGAGAGCATLAALGARWAGLEDPVPSVVAVGVGVGFFAGVLAGLVAFGGWALRRFDVARAVV